jgi:hypothetical protein
VKAKTLYNGRRKMSRSQLTCLVSSITTVGVGAGVVVIGYYWASSVAQSDAITYLQAHGARVQVDKRHARSVVTSVVFSDTSRSLSTRDIEYLLHCRDLGYLDLDGVEVDVGQLRQLAALPRLRTLRLVGTHRDFRTVRALASWPALEHLAITCTIDAEMVRAMSELKDLSVLDMIHCSFQAIGADVPPVKSVRSIAIVADVTNSKDLACLRQFPSLERLVVFGLEFDSQVTHVLAAVHGLREILVVEGTVSIDAFCSAAELDDIDVTLRSCKIDDECEMLASRYGWRLTGDYSEDSR